MKLIVLILSGLFTVLVHASEPISIRLASINSENDQRHQYAKQLLQLIISSSPIDIEVNWVSFPSEQQHITLLDKNVIDVFVTATDKDIEKKYHAIRYPMFKGLMGYRLVLVRNEDSDMLADVMDIEDLKKFSIGQGSQWQEAKIFAENGFEINTSRHYNLLFEMLIKKRFDLFPRSILEVWSEAQIFSSLGISIEPHVVLHHPLSMFYFVRNDSPELAQALESGFKVAIDNGSFDALFNQYHGNLINRAKLDKRTLIEIPNSFYPAVPEHEASLYLTY